MKELFQEKIEILQKVLDLTDNVTFKGDDGDADIYIELIEKRDLLFNRAKAIDAELVSVGYKGVEPASEPYRRRISALAKSIIERDNYMSETVTGIFNGLKAEVKNINVGKNINNVYSGVADSSSSLYDWSK